MTLSSILLVFILHTHSALATGGFPWVAANRLMHGALLRCMDVSPQCHAKHQLLWEGGGRRLLFSPWYEFLLELPVRKLNDQAILPVPEAFPSEFPAFHPCESFMGNIPYNEMKIHWERSKSITRQARHPVSESSETIMWSYSLCQSEAIAEFQIAHSELASSLGCQLSRAAFEAVIQWVHPGKPDSSFNNAH